MASKEQRDKSYSKNIYEKYLTELSSIYLKYRHFKITKKDFTTLSLRIIEEDKEFSREENFKQKLLEDIKEGLEEEILRKMSDKETTLKLLKTYIDRNLQLQNNDSIKETIEELERLLPKAPYGFSILNQLYDSSDKLRKAIKIIYEAKESNSNDQILEDYNNKILMFWLDKCSKEHNVGEKSMENGAILENVNPENINQNFLMYINDIKQYPVLSEEERKELFKRARKEDQEAEDLLVKSNLRLVINIAKKYQSSCFELLDVISEGNIGLIEAVRKYDYEKGYKFSTYAKYWIMEKILRAYQSQTRNIRLPEHEYQKVQQFKKAKQELEQQLMHEVSIKEMADHLKITEQQAAQLENLQTDTISVNVPLKDEEEREFDQAELIDILESDVDVESTVEQKLLEEGINRLLNSPTLTERERTILMLRNGFFGEPLTYNKISSLYNLSPQRARQIDIAARKKALRIAEKEGFEIYINIDSSSQAKKPKVKSMKTLDK